MEDIGIKPDGNIPLGPLTHYRIPDRPVSIIITQAGISASEYQVIEPEIRADQSRLLKDLRAHFVQIFRDKTRARNFLKNFSGEFLKIAKEFSPSLNADEISTFEYYIHRDSRGLGPLQPLIDDPFLNIISINGPDKKVNVQHLQYGPLITSTSLNEDEIHNILVKICNRSVSPLKLPIFLKNNSPFRTGSKCI